MGSTLGTPAFMPPEQAAGRLDLLGPASDVYSLGATLYSLLTGQTPFRDPERGRVLQQVQRGEFPAPRQVNRRIPAALEAICVKAMALQPGDRYPSPRALAADVEQWLADEPVAAYREPWRVRAGRWARRHKQLVTGLTVLAVTALVLGSGGAVWLQRQRAELRQGVMTSLTIEKGLLEQARWKDARNVLDEVEGRVGGWGLADLRQEVAQARADLDLAHRLDDIRQKRATIVEGKFANWEVALAEYAAAFRESGVIEEGEDEQTVAWKIRGSAIREQLVAALDDWAAGTQDRKHQAWLLKVARGADPDALRDRFRDPEVWRDRATLNALAGEVLEDEAKLAELKPTLLTALGRRLKANKGDAVLLLAAAQARHPNDFWLSFALGDSFHEEEEWDEAVGYYRAALAVRPEAVAVHRNLGIALQDKGDLDEAIREYRAAIALDPKYAKSHYSLGNALKEKKHLDEAIRAYRTAIELDPKYVAAHNNLGNALKAKGQLDEAIREYRAAIALDPKYVRALDNLGNALRDKGQLEEAIQEYRKASKLDPKSAEFARDHNNLGNALKAKGRLGEAIGEYRAAIALDPKHAEAHCNLGLLLQTKGQYVEALALLRRGHELGSMRPGWRYPSAEWVRQAERMPALDILLPKVLNGEADLPDAADLMELARFATHQKRMFAATATLFKDVFRAHPGWAEAKIPPQPNGLPFSNRRFAVAAAAMAAAGAGDGAALTQEQRAAWRGQARDWIRSELEAWKRRLEGATPEATAEIVKLIADIQVDGWLASVRDLTHLDRLPPAEREACQTLWADVEALRKQAGKPE
jgi:tetratricopeptide (TPR) repeat protein